MTSTENILPVLKVRGSNYEIGLQIGKFFKERIKKALNGSKFLKLLHIYNEKEPSRFTELMKIAKNNFPDLVLELEGIASGADVNFKDIALITMRHSYNIETCSTVGMIDRTKNQIILAHNEDHEIDLGKYSYIIQQECKNGISFFSHCYPGSLPGGTFWFNSEGVGLTGNAITEPNKGINLPKAFLDRKSMESKSLDELLEILQTPNRIGGYSYNAFSLKEGRLINIETSSNKSVITEISDNFAHTNHYITKKFADMPFSEGGSSDTRLKGCLSGLKTANFSLKAIREIIFQDSVHADNVYDTPFGKTAIGTIVSAVFNVDGKKNSLEMTLYGSSKDINIFQSFSLKDL